MKRVFIETQLFVHSMKQHLTEEEFRKLQLELLKRPNAGDVMPGCGGLRKIRVGSSKSAKGKKGGVRVIYFDIPEASLLFFVAIYGKNEKEDLDESTKKALKELARKSKISAKKRMDK